MGIKLRNNYINGEIKADWNNFGFDENINNLEHFSKQNKNELDVPFVTPSNPHFVQDGGNRFIIWVLF